MITNELKLLDPPIRCYLHHAYPLTVAQANKDFFPWLYSNYIQLQYDLNEFRLNFFTYEICGNNVYCPLLDYRILDSELLHLSSMNIINFIVDCINMGYYVIIYFDEYFIPERFPYRKYHFRHESMIFGYNLNSKTFKIIGFNDKEQYSISCVSFSQFMDSYDKCIDKKNDVIIFKAKDELSYRPSYKFDIVNVIALLEDYYYSRDTGERLRVFNHPKEGFIYGISVYKQLIGYFEMAIEGNKEYITIMNLFLLWEHKKCMVSRIKYLIANNFIDNNAFEAEYINLEEKALSLKNILLKFNYTKNKKYLEKIIADLYKISDTEEQLTSYLLDKLKGINHYR